MIEFFKNVGLTIFAAVFLAMPALAVLSVIFSWGLPFTIILGLIVFVELLLFVIVVGALADEDIW